uniref:RNA helicase n=1 Tax=Anopheles epiroticus TaxID=199890 RepID=A0A182PR90_9DIPT
MSEVDNVIRITRYINPHCFYYKSETAYLQDHEQMQFTVAFNQHCEAVYGELYKAVRKPQAWEIEKPGTLVALRSIQLERWIRCLVEETLEDLDESVWYQLWAIDEGFPLKSDPKYVRPLPAAFAQEPAHAKRGALIDVLPSDTRFDYVENKHIQEPSSRWCAGIVTTLEGCLEEATSVSMVQKAKLAWQNEIIHFVELYVTDQNNTSGNVTELLQAACPKQIIVTPPSEFIKAILKIQTLDVKRYLNNDGFCDKRIVNNFIPKSPHNVHQPHRELEMDTEVSQKVQEWLRRNKEACMAMLQQQKEKEEQQKVSEIIKIIPECQQKDASNRTSTVASNNPVVVMIYKDMQKNEASVNLLTERPDHTVMHVGPLTKPSPLLLTIKRHKARMVKKNAASYQQLS